MIAFMEIYYECNNCEWKGHESECLTYKHASDARICPQCSETCAPAPKTTDHNPLDPTNHQFRKCIHGHVAYSIAFDECPSCKIERARSGTPKTGEQG